MKNLSLRQLQVFDAFAGTLSYSGAAEVLGITQPAVSMLMRQLAVDAGMALTERRGRHLGLTAAGLTLLRHARSILEQMRLAEESLSNLQSNTCGPLRLGVVSTAHYFAPQLMREFQRQKLELPMSFKLSVVPRDEILTLLATHRLDVAIAGQPPGDAEVEAEPFARHPYCMVAPPGHRLAGQRGIPWHELRHESFIFREAGSMTRQFLEHLLQAQGLEVNVTLELSGNETIKQAVMAEMGISFMSAHAMQLELAVGRMVVLDVVDMPKWLDWCVLHRRDKPLTGLHAAFRDFVRTQGASVVTCQWT